MLKCANVASEILLELECIILINLLQLTSITYLFDVKLFFYEFKLLNMNFYFYFVWLYII
jgi:hypothetical protein